MTVSIIVPIYNAEAYIERCAKSIFEQSYSDLQIIFIDDNSQDRTLQVLQNIFRNYPERRSQIVLRTLDENLGVANARQIGLDLADGDYVTQIDADDYISTDYIQNMLDVATCNNCDIVICDFVYLLPTRKKYVHVSFDPDPEICLARVMTGEMHAGFMNKLVRRSLYTQNGFRMVPGLNMFEDKAMMVRLLSSAKVLGYVPKAMYFYDKTNAHSATAQAKSRQVYYLEKAWEDIENYSFNRLSQTQVMLDAIEYYRIGILGSILLFSEKSLAQYKSSIVRRPSVGKIWSHPTIPYSYKLVLVLYSLKQQWLVSVLRYLYHAMK